ncbi:MAG TPA: T9SS type A sorting domain-containing protein [Chitinophagales bacterium]|nr:T9SS type A sorting domain-containing protein [Chitinophagales bacterium]
MFTIQPNNVVTVTAPNGGEVLPALGNYTITWTNTAGASGTYNVEYSSNNGSTWNTLATNISGNTYNWTSIPNVPTATYLVRVSDYANTCRNDVSNANFTVTPAQPVLYSPNGGEAYNWDCNLNISWNTATFYSTVRLDYSLDSGLTWQLIVNGTSNSGSYSWTVPQTITGKMLIKASNTANLSLYDISNNVFSIVRPVTITSPNGGEVLRGCDANNLTFTKTTCLSGSYVAYYSTDNGANWSFLGSSSSSSSNVTIAWTVPNNISSTQCLVRVYNSSYPAAADTSNAVFTIQPNNAITVTSPNGGEVLPALSNYVITWTNTAGASGTYNVEYSSNNGSTWNTLATNISGNTYNWTSIPNVPTATYLVRVSDYANTCRNDVSNANFTVTPAQPVLYSPNGGESIWSATNYNILWNTASFYSAVRLEYSLDNGVSWQVITTSTTNNGSYSWTVPNANSTTCLVKASNTSNVNLNDVSNNVFTIKPAVKVFTPNGLDQLGACTQTSITFDHTPAYTAYTIEYSINNGSTWTTLVNNQTFNGTTGTYSWSVPNIPTTQARVRVYPTGSVSLADVSDTTFTIKRAVTIIQPNFGGVLQVGTTYPIIWSSDGISNLYDLAYSTNGGTSWTNIILGYNTSTNTYNWTVPNTASTNCLIRIRDNINSCKEDISDLAFTISSTAAPITITAPNGQDTIQGCQYYTIRWTESGTPLGAYTIDYTTDGGVSWLPVVSNYATTAGTYQWVVPNINTTTALVRVSSSANNTIFDLSNAAFNIFGRSVVAGPDTVICTGNQVQLQATGGTGTFSWSPAGTLSNANIANPIATPSVTTSYVASSGNGTCIMRDTATITVLNGTTTTVGVTIAASPSAAVCAGNQILFTATPSNGGTNPVYQWKKNGNNVGSNSANYILNPATNNDVISCVVTSNAACATNNPATSNLVTVTVFPSVSPTVTIATASTTVCASQAVTFTATPANGGNAPVYQWKINGNNAGTNNTSFTTSLLNNNDVVTCELTSNAACVNNSTASSNALLMTVTPSIVPSVSINTATTTVCNGSSVTFTASPVNGGTTPAYQWRINGNNAGTNSATFTTTTLANNDVVTCVLTSNANCALPVTATSNSIAMSVTGSVTPSVTVNASATTICAGGSVTFTATPLNGGATPAYQWRINNTNSGNNSNTFTSSSLNNNDTVRVILTSSSGCAIPTTGISAPVIITVNPTVAPAVTITGSNSICAGAATTFTASATNAGSSPVYQWKVNNINAGTNSNTFTTSTLANSDSVYCIVTSSSGCAIPNTATSNKITVTVAAVVLPAISISTNANSICSGTNAVFTAAATNAGSGAVYQWKLNGSNVGTNSASYSTTALANNDIVSCILTSSAACAQPVTVTSNAITMSVTTNAAPAITISTATANLCTGASVTFSATISNGGANPVYQWKINGNNAGTNNATFTTNALVNNDVVTCALTSSALCASPATAISNAIPVTVGATITPAINITASATTICTGAQVTFTANTTGSGATPVYQWKVNGNNAGTNSATFASTTLTNNDVVTCQLTSSAACAVPSSATSNGITVTVNSNSTPAISISANNTAVCAGTPVTFTAVATNGGNTPAYQWKVNGNNAGSNQSAFTLTNVANGDVVTCQLTSSQACASPSIVSSNAVTLSVSNSVTPAISISANSTNICSGPITFTASAVNEGTTPVYQWRINNSNTGTNSAVFTTSGLSNNDVVSCVLTSNASCASANTATSNAITVTGSTATPVATVAASSNTICSGAPVTFTVSVSNGGSSQAYQWKLNGANVGSNSNTYTTTSISAADSVSCIVTVTSSCSGTLVATSNKASVQITPSVSADVSIAATATSICQGTAVTFSATGTNAGIAPVYQWAVNGIIAGGSTSQFISSTLNNGDTVICRMSSSVACALPATAVSNGIVVMVTPAVIPTVSISPSAVTVCQGSSVTFTATATNGGANPAYQWKLNNVNTGSNSTTYSSNNIANGDVIYCEVTSSAACAQPVAASSNAVTVNITTPVTPGVSITASAASICSGQSVTFTATSINGGNAPVYAWQVNGNSVSTGSNTFTSNTLANGDVVSCQLNSNAACVTATTALSNTITISSGNAVTPAITINASATTICTGTTVTVTANATNGGTTPAYQWLVNGTPAGNNSAVFTSSAFNNGDVITCVLTSNAGCTTTNTATSTPITFTVTNGLQPTVTVTASADSICAGSMVTFTANAVNAGNSPAYQWLLNGTLVGSNSNTYTSNTLTGSDVVTCEVTSNAGCSNGTTVTSTPLSVTVNTVLTPTVTISTTNTTICSGQNTVFTAAPVNGGNTPVYQWLVNGTNAGGNSDVFATTALTNSDVVTVELTSNAECVTTPNAVSSPVTMVVNSSVNAEVIIESIPADTICYGTTVVFTASPVNGGNTPAYQWKLNGNNTGSGAVTYSSNTLNDGDIIQVEMTSSATCVNQATVISAGKVITVNSLPAAPVISQSGNVLTSSAPAGNQWYASSQPVSGAVAQTYTANNSGWYSVSVTDVNGCSSTGDSVYLQYTGINDIDWNTAIDIMPNPFANQFKVRLNSELLASNDWTITVTDALGRVVYERNNLIQENVIDFTHRAAGIYVVSLKNETTLRSYKVVKQ